jgi:hypothetical protein
MIKAFKSDEEAEEEVEVMTEEDLEKANIKNVERSGELLENRYFLRLLQFVGEKTRESTKNARAVITTERRAHYKA